MVERLFDGLVSLLGQKGFAKNAFEKEMLTYAKTEYGRDWQYAYQYTVSYTHLTLPTILLV